MSEPMEQIDYGGNYRAYQSPQQTMTLKVEGGLLAVAIALVALGAVLVATILLPQLAQSHANEAVAVALRPISAQVASAQDRAWLAERNSFATAEQLKILQAELATAGKPVRLDGH